MSGYRVMLPSQIYGDPPKYMYFTDAKSWSVLKNGDLELYSEENHTGAVLGYFVKNSWAAVMTTTILTDRR